MKRVIIVWVILVITTTAGNAQFFVEGSVGARFWRLSYLNGVYKDNPPGHSLSVSPLVGYRLNKNVALGVRATLVSDTEKGFLLNLDTGEKEPFERRGTGWSLAVFDRYKLWGRKKFSFLLESSVYMSKYNHIEKRGTTTYRNENLSKFGINAVPLISYDLSDRLSLMIASDLLSLGLYAQTLNYKDTGLKMKSVIFDFNIQSAFFDNLAGIRVGVIYHFKKTGK